MTTDPTRDESGWLPIETAPKDGTPVLLFIEESVIEASFFDEVDISGERYGDGYWRPVSLSSHGCGCCSETNAAPIAWQPLPPPPEQSS